MRFIPSLRIPIAFVALSTALLGLPAVADAAKVKISAAPVSVTPGGVAAIGLKNPNRSTAKGKLSLTADGQGIGSRAFSIGARRSKTVNVPLTVGGFNALQQSGNLFVGASAKAKRFGTSRRGLTLSLAGAGGGGDATQPGTPPPPPAGGGSSLPWQEGRWQGTYQRHGLDLAFNITGNRLYTGPFDMFSVEATCHNTDPDYGGDEQVYKRSKLVEPVEVTISPDGSFSGSGTNYDAPNQPVNWTLTGRVSGGSLTGTISVDYKFGGGTDPCSGSENFTARYYGDYTL